MPTKDQDKLRRYRREHYARNDEYYKGQVRQHKRDIAAFVWSTKVGKACLRCGFPDRRALEYHHRNASTKDANLSGVSARGWSQERIEAEIAKCDLICANCHAIEHDKRVRAGP